jgi:hypothetical protein
MTFLGSFRSLIRLHPGRGQGDSEEAAFFGLGFHVDFSTV